MRQSGRWRLAATMTAVLGATGTVTAMAIVGEDADRGGAKNSSGVVMEAAVQSADAARTLAAQRRAKLRRGRQLIARWAFHPNRFDEVVNNAPIAVHGTIVEIKEGPSFEEESAFHSPDEALGSQTIGIQVNEVYFGEAPDRFVLEHVGNDRLWLSGDPPYVLGEQYIFFVKQVPDGRFINPSPDGRILIDQGRVRPVMEGPIGRSLRGRPASEVRDLAKRTKEGR